LVETNRVPRHIKPLIDLPKPLVDLLKNRMQSKMIKPQILPVSRSRKERAVDEGVNVAKERVVSRVRNRTTSSLNRLAQPITASSQQLNLLKVERQKRVVLLTIKLGRENGGDVEDGVVVIVVEAERVVQALQLQLQQVDYEMEQT
jgi:hypothetical protein